MNKLSLVVCKNFEPEFEEILKQGKYGDVELITYPALCSFPAGKKAIQTWWKNNRLDNREYLIICGNYCGILKDTLNELPQNRICKLDNCFYNMTGKKVIDGYIEDGAYIVTGGWLKNWRNNLILFGFDQETARKFFKESAKYLVYLDSGIVPEYQNEIREMSQYIKIPYKIVFTGLYYLELLVSKIVTEWRLNFSMEKCKSEMNTLRKQCADYATMINIIGRLSDLSSEVEVIKNLIDSFNMLFAPKSIEYYRYKDDITDNTDEKIKTLINVKNKKFVYTDLKNGFVLKIASQDDILGFIKLEGFAFPEYCDRYLNLALNIINVCALAISNSRKYYKIKENENILSQISTHDALTGLYNRFYFEQYLNNIVLEKSINTICIIMCDVDGLKKINDTYGHIEGDRLICAAADTIKKSFRECDIVSRIGGDEFAVIVTNCNAEMAKNLKNRLNYMIIQYNNNQKDDKINLSISSGYSVSETVLLDIDSLINEADRLMYQEKFLKKQGIV